MLQSDVREFETGTGVLQEEGSFFTGTKTAQSRERTFVTYDSNLLFAGYSTLNYGYGRYGEAGQFLDSLDYVIKGKVKGETQNIENVKVYLMNQDTGEIEQTTTTDENGDYIFEDLSSEVLYSVGCLEYREENGETIRYNERTFYDIEPKENV